MLVNVVFRIVYLLPFGSQCMDEVQATNKRCAHLPTLEFYAIFGSVG